jgi:oxysterol-binding protein-related protein 9/10/11
MPNVHVDGLLSGSLFLELGGSSYIRSSSGYSVKIDYSGKGWLSGKRNSFLATVFRDADDAGGQPATPLYVVEGQWSDAFALREAESHCEVEKFCLPAVPRTPLTTAPLEQQHPLESRRAWRHVASAIRAGDVSTVGREKSRIENEQREMRRREKCAGVEYPRLYFSRACQDPVAERLAEELKDELSLDWGLDELHGVWLWDEEKFRRAS